MPRSAPSLHAPPPPRDTRVQLQARACARCADVACVRAMRRRAQRARCADVAGAWRKDGCCIARAALRGDRGAHGGAEGRT